LRHADHHHRVLLYGLLNFCDDVLLVCRNALAYRGVDVVAGEYGAVHRWFLVECRVWERGVYALAMSVTGLVFGVYLAFASRKATVAA
jgi:hypothetical protein